MELYNCYSKEEKILKEIELQGLDSKRLVSLAQLIKEGWDEQKLEDETIVIDALTQISEELGKRNEVIKKLKGLKNELIEYIVEAIGSNDKDCINSILIKYGEEKIM